MLDLFGVGLSVGGKPILHDLNLHVLPGEIHAILGMNGTGKSTLNPRLSIVDEPDSGIDALSLNHILDAIRLLAKNGASVLLITHQNEIAVSADRASSLKNMTSSASRSPCS